MTKTNENHTQLIGLITTSDFFYQLYINNNKSKSKARILKAINQELSKYIINEFPNYAQETKEDLSRLLEHTLSFISQWEEYDRINNINESDEFAYKTIIPFPRDSARRLIAHSTIA